MRGSVSRHGGQNGKGHGHRPTPCRDDARPGAVADPLRALLVAAILAGTVMMVGEFRERALANSERELENTVLLLTRHFDQQFEDSDTIAADMISQMRFRASLRRRHSGNGCRARGAHEILSSKAGVLSYLGDITIFDSNGDMITWSRPLPAPAVNISGPSLFRDFQVRPAITIGAERGSSEPYHRQSEHRHCPSADRRRRGVPRRDDTAHHPLQLREILCVRRARDRPRRSRCSMSTGR